MFETLIHKPEGVREIWRRSFLIDQRYEVSNLGRVGLNRKPGEPRRLLKGHSTDGVICYKIKTAAKDRKKNFSAIRLVSSAFLGIDVPGNSIAYRDGDRTNIRPENLLVLSSISEGIAEKRARGKAIASNFSGEIYIRTEKYKGEPRFVVYLGVKYKRAGFKVYGGSWQTMEAAIESRDRMLDRYDVEIELGGKMRVL